MPADRQRVGQGPVNGARDRQSDPLETVVRRGLSPVRGVFPWSLDVLNLGHFLREQVLERLPLGGIGFARKTKERPAEASLT